MEIPDPAQTDDLETSELESAKERISKLQMQLDESTIKSTIAIKKITNTNARAMARVHSIVTPTSILLLFTHSAIPSEFQWLTDSQISLLKLIASAGVLTTTATASYEAIFKKLLQIPDDIQP